MQRIYFGLVPKEIGEEAMLSFFRRTDAELQNFSFNSKLLSYNFGFFDTLLADKVLKHNGQRHMGFLLRVRPAKRAPYEYHAESQPDDRELVYQSRGYLCQQEALLHRTAELGTERAKFRQIPAFGELTSDDEHSQSILFEYIVRRPSAKEFCGIKKVRRPIIPVRNNH